MNKNYYYNWMFLINLSGVATPCQDVTIPGLFDRGVGNDNIS